MSEADQRRHEHAAVELLHRLGLPASDASVLTWFDGKTRLIVLWIKPSALKRCQQQIPVRFDGFEVVVERMPKAHALAA